MFEVAPEDVAGEMFDAAFERWFEKILDNPGEGMRRLLRRRDLSARTGPRAIARRAALELMNWRDFDSPWQHSPIARDAEIDAIIAEVEALGKLAELGEDDDWLAKGLDAIARPVAEATRLEAVRGRDHDALESVLIAAVHRAGAGIGRDTAAASARSRARKFFGGAPSCTRGSRSFATMRAPISRRCCATNCGRSSASTKI